MHHTLYLPKIVQPYKTSHLLITRCHFVSHFPLPVCSVPPSLSYSLCFFFPYIYLLISPCSLSCPAFPLLGYLLLLFHFHNPLDCAHLSTHPLHVPPPFISASHLSPSPAPCSSRLLLRTRAAVCSNLATREFWTKSVTTDTPAETRAISHPDNQHF